jgi:hypothetical protein
MPVADQEASDALNTECLVGIIRKERALDLLATNATVKCVSIASTCSKQFFRSVAVFATDAFRHQLTCLSGILEPLYCSVTPHPSVPPPPSPRHIQRELPRQTGCLEMAPHSRLPPRGTSWFSKVSCSGEGEVAYSHCQNQQPRLSPHVLPEGRMKH